MSLRTARTGFLLLASLIAGGFPFTESPEPARSEWEHFNERCASDSLKTLTSPEADFRGCSVNDFWNGDVKGLYTMGSAEVREPEIVRCVPIQYWDGIGTWHGNLWMLYQMCAGARADTIRLIELDSGEK